MGLYAAVTTVSGFIVGPELYCQVDITVLTLTVVKASARVYDTVCHPQCFFQGHKKTILNVNVT